MALQFADSFDHYTDLETKWTVQSSCSIVSGGRRGGNCLQVPSGGSFISRTLTPASSWIVGYAMKWTGGLNVGGGWATSSVWTSSSGNVFNNGLCSTSMNPDRTISMYAFQALMGYTAGFAIQTDVWYYFEIECSFGGDPVVTTATLKINGQTMLSGVSGSTGLALSGFLSGGAQSNQHSFYPSNQYVLVDDLYVMDTSGTLNNSFSGDLAVQCIYPVSDSGTSYWTPSSGSAGYAMVNENPPDGDTTYISSSTFNNYDDFAFTTVSSSVGNILAVQLNTTARKDNEGTRALQPRVSGVVAGNDIYLGDAYLNYVTPFDENPTTLTGWSVTEINASTFGIDLVV
jgi:hypothetical protein